MTVYVDDAQIHYRGCLMCHMFADTTEELHAMADRIGLRRSWFQKGGSLEHYDVSLTKRALAIRCGARLINREQLRALIRMRMDSRRGGKAHGASDKDVTRPPAVGPGLTPAPRDDGENPRPAIVPPGSAR